MFECVSHTHPKADTMAHKQTHSQGTLHHHIHTLSAQQCSCATPKILLHSFTERVVLSINHCGSTSTERTCLGSWNQCGQRLRCTCLIRSPSESPGTPQQRPGRWAEGRRSGGYEIGGQGVGRRREGKRGRGEGP